MNGTDQEVRAAAVRSAVLKRWQEHEFYRSAVVLGLDVGVEGIGVWVRKGPTCIFRGTFVVPLPVAAPLRNRRLLRAGRHAREAGRRRDRMLKDWVVKYGLLPPERVEQLWNNPAAFERAFEHRWRAIAGEKPLASPEALMVCIRHCVRHRGYDHHLLFREENLTFPWGDELKIGEIRKWAATGVLPEEYGAELRMIVEESGDLKEAEKTEVVNLLEAAIARYRSDPVRQALEAHMSQRQHPNLRPPARGHNFPRELVKAHLRAICERHRHFFPADRFDEAMKELIGPLQNGVETYDPKAESIMDWHRRTPEEAQKLWERREGRCAVAPHLIAQGRLPPRDYRRSAAGDPAVRTWRTLQFLAERRVELATGERRHVPSEIVRQALDFVREDAAAWTDRQKRPKAPDLRKAIQKALGPLMPKTRGGFNEDFFDQLGDILKPSAARLQAKAPICAEAARVLTDIATGNNADFEPDRIRERLENCGYYQWRKQSDTGPALYHQVDFLLGDPRQFDPVTGEPRDRRDGIPRQHGLLRRLFAGQLRLDTGELVDLREHLDGRTVPDYVVIECVRDMPRNAEQRREIQNELKERREERRKIAQQYGLDFDRLTDTEIRRLLLFNEQAGKDGIAICPYTGEQLGRNPLDSDLEIEHIFPQSRGGISIMENLVITRRSTNADKGDRTPVEWLGRTRAVELASRMRWSNRKREVFLWEAAECPDWQNLTRTAQLARELRRRVVEWLGIARTYQNIADPIQRSRSIEAEIRRRVAAPSGALTAACREAWKDRLPSDYFVPRGGVGPDRLIKNRGNLRHHMWDAGILANIPPGDGLNSVECGGIFETIVVCGEPRPRPLPELAPDIERVERQDPLTCRVHRLRQRHPKSSRTQQQPISLPDDKGVCWQRVEVVKVVDEKQGVVKEVRPDDLIAALRKAGISEERISDDAVRAWINDPRPQEQHPLRLRDGTPVWRLRLPIPQQKDEVGVHPHVTTRPAGEKARRYRSAKGHTKGWLIGLKGATETFDRLEIWRGPKLDRQGKPVLASDGSPVWVYKSFPVPTARNIAAYRRMWGRPPPIRRPEGVTERVGIIRKGDVLLVPFGPCQDGDLELSQPGSKPFAPLWMRVASIKATGEVTLVLAEYATFESTILGPRVGARSDWRPRSAQILARLLAGERGLNSKSLTSSA